MPRGGKSGFCSGPVFNQSLSGRRQLLEIMKRFVFGGVRFELQQRAHLRQHRSIDTVRFGHLAIPLAKPASFTRINSRKVDPVLGQALFDAAMITRLWVQKSPGLFQPHAPKVKVPSRPSDHCETVCDHAWRANKRPICPSRYRSQWYRSLSFPHLVLSCGPKSPRIRSGRKKKLMRPNSVRLHADQEWNGPIPATARHK